jgi:MIP family channel proteins
MLPHERAGARAERPAKGEMMNQLTRGCVAEFLGTFALVFFGCGSIVLTQGSIGAGSLMTVAAAHATALIVFVGACMYVSGAQFNPAVSIGVALAGKQSWVQAGAFIVVQLVASACAAGLLVAVLGRGMTDPVNLGATLGSMTLEGVGKNAVGAAVLEGVMTFALMFVIFAAVVDERAHRLGGLCVGLTVLACIVGFGPLTGASMNPARTFGPLLYHWEVHAPVVWVYVAGPVAGAAAAAAVYKVVWGVAPRQGA